MENLSLISKNKIFKYVDKVFFVFSLFYLFFIIFWINRPVHLKYSISNHKYQLSNISNSQFLFYLQQSLKVIKQNHKNEQTVVSSHPIIERVYVPLYSSAKLANKLSTLNAFSPTAKILPIPLPTKNYIQVKSIPLPTVALPSSTKKYEDKAISESNIKLIGVLDSGSESIALFDIQGIIKRLKVGDAIADSGWLFQGVSQQKILISKQGSLRYIEIGQTF